MTDFRPLSYLVQDDAAMSSRPIDEICFWKNEIASPRFRGDRNDDAVMTLDYIS
jgi:hypothetical protein